MQRRLLDSFRACALVALACTFGGTLVPAEAQRRPPRNAKTPFDLPEPEPPRKRTRVASSGTFTDRSGAKFTWNVDEKNALYWNGQPYLPIGGTFQPRSFAQSDGAAWQADAQALAAMKTAGVSDLLIQPAKPLFEISLASLQRLVDYLDNNGFRYGFGFGPGLTKPLQGVVVKPGSYRYDTRDSLTAQWQVDHADNGLFVLTDAGNENKIVQMDVIPIKDRVVSVPIEPPPGSTRIVALLYPHKALPNKPGTLPDLWNGFDSYRDRLVTHLSQVKFGAGLRFFQDPLAPQLGLGGETDYLIPDSGGFSLEFEAFLSNRYPTVEEVKQSWGIAEGEFKSYADFARLIPCWAHDRGVPYLLDPEKRRIYRILDAVQSAWWSDFLQMRNESVLYYMNALAGVLKRQVANVPVVYSCTQFHPIFLNNETDSGFDGLSVVTHNGVQEQFSRVVGPAYSLAQQSARHLWCMALPSQSASVAPAELDNETRTVALTNGQPPQNANARRDLFADLNLLRNSGYKAFFVGSYEPGTALSASPTSLAALKEYTGVSPNYAPSVLFFPYNAPGPAKTGFVPDDPNVLWLSSFTNGTALDWWPSYSGYILREEGKTEYVLISLQGERKTRFTVRDAKRVEARTPSGDPVPIKLLDKFNVEVTLSSRPTILSAGGQGLFPQEAATDAIVQLAALFEKAQKEKVPSTEEFIPVLDRAKFGIKQKDFENTYNLTRGGLDELIVRSRPFIWEEGENPFRGNVHTFSEVARHVGASGGRYLWLSTPNPPGRLGYSARYTFDVPREGAYNVWLAGSIPGPNVSAISWRMNSAPEQRPVSLKPEGPLWANEQFGWTLLGTVRLSRGQGQSVTIYVTDPAEGTKEYTFGIDALLLTENEFLPNGVIRPVPIPLKPMRSANR